jgi:hypothetical protein
VAPQNVFDHFGEGADLIVGLGNGEPVTVIDALEEGGDRHSGVTIHQMFPLHERRYMHGDIDGLRHVSWYLSPANREAFHEGGVRPRPQQLLRRTAPHEAFDAPIAGPRGSHAEYMAAMIGEAPFFLEVNRRMPRTFGENQMHVSQIAGWCEADYPLVEPTPRPMRETDRRIMEYVAERILDGATLQIGIGVLPNEVLGMLGDHTDLGVHSELFAEGFVDLVERGVVTGSRKLTHRNKIITTTAIGS